MKLIREAIGMEELKIEKCFDVIHELEKAAILFKTEAKFLQFEILKVYTFLSEEEQGKKNELSNQRAEEFFSSKEYEEDRYFIFQAYDILIKKEEKKGIAFNLELSGEASKLFFICPKDNYKEILKDLGNIQKRINAQKALLGVIFKNFSYQCNEEELKKILKNTQDDIGNTFKILLEYSEFYHPIVDASFFFTLKEEWELKNKKSLENSSYAVKEGMEAGKLFKSRNGVEGRNLLGKYIKIEKREPLEIEFGALNEDFLITDLGDYLLYKSLKDGFVGLNSSGLILIKDFSFEEINHRNMGNLLGGIECGFELNVKASAPEKDAIGAGIIIEAQKINVNGSVDQGVVLKAKECVISGSIHQSSEIEAQEAEIATHKGKLKAEIAKIKLCENGSIDCMQGEIEDCIGGEIRCKTIKIGVLHANSKISLCSEVEVAQMKGGGNDFKIDSSAFFEYREQIESILKRYKKHNAIIERLIKIYRQELFQIKKMKPAIECFKTVFAQNIQKGIQTQPYVIGIIGRYAGMCRRIKKIKEKIQSYKTQAEMVKQEIEPFALLCLKAKILCQTPWVGQNQVEYFDCFLETKETLLIEDGEKINIYIDEKSHKLTKERIQA